MACAAPGVLQRLSASLYESLKFSGIRDIVSIPTMVALRVFTWCTASNAAEGHRSSNLIQYKSLSGPKRGEDGSVEIHADVIGKMKPIVAADAAIHSPVSQSLVPFKTDASSEHDEALHRWQRRPTTALAHHLQLPGRR